MVDNGNGYQLFHFKVGLGKGAEYECREVPFLLLQWVEEKFVRWEEVESHGAKTVYLSDSKNDKNR